MNIILYCRVSTDEQADGCSLEIQEKFLRAYCDNHGYTIVGEEQPYKEDYSAKHYDLRRPELRKIYDYCKRHKNTVDKVLFLRWDRFTRNLEFALTYKRKFYDELGIEINAIESPIDFNGAEWSMMLGMYCGVAHTEDEKISRRTKDGIHGTLLKGKCANKAPRGYINVRTDKHNTHVEIEEDKAQIVRNAFKEVAKGIETPCRIRRKVFPKISESSFFEMLRNPFYIGKIRVPAYKDEKEQIVNGVHEPLIDEETFYKVQDILDGKRKKIPKLSKAINPDLFLRKFLICPVCGHAITGSTSKGNGGQYTYYHCENSKHIRKRAEDVNEGFAHYVGCLKPNETVLNLYREILQDLRNEHNKDSLREVEAHRKEIHKKEDMLNALDEKLCCGTIKDEDYNRIAGRFKSQIEELQQKVSLMTNRGQGVGEKIDYSVNIINNLAKIMMEANVEVKCKVLSSMFPEKIEYDGKNYRTEKYNQVLDLIFKETNKLRGKENKNAEKPEDFSASVPRAAFENTKID